MTAVHNLSAAKQGRAHRSTRKQSLMWILVALPVVAIPFENQYSLFGLSLAKLTIAPLLVAVVLVEPARLLSVVKHPIFVCGAAFLAWAFMAELLRPSSDIEFLVRVAQTLLYAVLIAAASRHREILNRVLMTLVAVSASLAFYLIVNFHGLLNIEGMDFKTASQVRANVLADTGLVANLNILAYTVGMGAIVSLTKVLTKDGWRRIVWAAIYVLCAIGATIPASRGAFLALIAGSLLIGWRATIRTPKSAKKVLIVGGLLIAFYAFTPETLTSRLSSLVPSNRGDVEAGKQESRVTVYTAALDALPRYWALGIGSGNFWDGWGQQNGFSHETARGTETLGPHNGFFAAWIFFGLPGFVLLCLTCLMAGRAVPNRTDKRWDARSLTGLLVLGLFWLLFTHDLYLKQFGLILGLAMARDFARVKQWNNVGKTLTHHLRHQAIGPRRIGKAIVPVAPTTISKPNRIRGSNA